MTNQNYEVSVTAPVGLAIERMRRILFQPFDFRKWFVIGFCAWLAHLGEGGANSGFNFNSWNRPGGGAREQAERVKDYVMSNLSWMIPLVVSLILVGVAVWVVLLWLSSRGRFMFLHCVALDRAEVEEPWRKFAREGNSLFWFRLVLGLVAMIVMLPLGALMGFTIFRMVDAGSASTVGVLTAALAGLAMVGLGMAFLVITKLTTDFVVPIMSLRGTPCRAAWNELRSLFSANLGHLILYLLFQILLGIIIWLMVFLVVIVTCCVAGCFLAIPYLGTVLLLPVLIFSRCYSLYYLAQFGPQFDVFPPPVVSTPPIAGL